MIYNYHFIFLYIYIINNMSTGYKPLKSRGVGWTLFKIIYPFVFLVTIIAIYAILFAISVFPPIGTIVGLTGFFITGPGAFLVAFIFTLLTLYRVYKRGLSLTSPYTWFCYILYSIFVPGGSLITAWELR